LTDQREQQNNILNQMSKYTSSWRQIGSAREASL